MEMDKQIQNIRICARHLTLYAYFYIMGVVIHNNMRMWMMIIIMIIIPGCGGDVDDDYDEYIFRSIF